MSNILRASCVWSKSLKPLVSTSAQVQTRRSFHSPFAVLGNTHSNTPSIASSVYEKQVDHDPEPVKGQKTYVVSEPDPSNAPYRVPAGAFPTSLPYTNFTPTEPPPNYEGQMSSTSSNLAHPVLTRAAPQNESGVGESSAVRHSVAPGSMGDRGGSYGGSGLTDEKGTTRPDTENSLADRNPPPIDSEVVEKFSKLGVKDAWQARK
ncbi:hypothetical protein D9757_001470 [Collybiopsis confluens]|uniref:Uncharacterized protein n=1 Tax=Collybiopsis confluens TaxID=2823264 RepID=A0A8H5HZF3_9AGAR|nr:hypothetical protein D9757_001470 [Collybiopsis confluens]